MDNSGLIVDFTHLTVEDYVALSVAFDDDDQLAILDILDRYAPDGLRKAPWPVWFAALEQASAQIEPVEQALDEAKTQAAFANMVARPTWMPQQ